MRELKNISIALRALGANKLRSLLTILGIIIGVASVITMIAIGEGAHFRVSEQIRSLGSNLLMVRPDDGAGSLRPMPLTEADATAIHREVASVTAASPSVRDVALIVFGNKRWQALLTGTDPNYFIARNWPIATGRTFNESEVNSAAKVVVLGSTVADGLFGDADPIGKTIRVANVPVTVVGVLSAKGASGSGRDQDDVIFAPIKTTKLRMTLGQNLGHMDAVEYILVKIDNASEMGRAESQIASLLRQRHHLDAGQANDFQISDPAATMAAQRGATRTLTYLLLAVASVSLVVGGISITNIMLVSVTERTREIGLRMAVGARSSDILKQFMTEAITLCAFGGLIGVLLGIVASFLIASAADWPIFIGYPSVVLSICFAAVVGFVSGFYPALKAARLDPIDALRFE